MKKVPCLRIRASDLAKYTGHNAFESETKVVADFWSRNPRVATLLGVELDAYVDDEVMGAIVKKDSYSQSVIARALGTEDTRPESLAKVIREKAIEPIARAQSTVEADAVLAAIPAVLQETLPIENESRKLRGVLREETSTNIAEVSIGRPIVQRNAEHLQKELMEIFTPSFGSAEVELAGVVDGRFKDTGEVVEMKERRHRLFHRVYDYEKVQLHAYMFLTSTRQATLVETHDSASLTHHVEFDDAFWSECLAKLRTFLECRLSTSAGKLM